MDIAGLVKGASSGEGLGDALPSHLAASLSLTLNPSPLTLQATCAATATKVRHGAPRT